MNRPILLKSNYTIFFLVIILTTSFFFIRDVNAYDAKVVITNGTNHCKPDPSCYKPYQVNVSIGDTITWINQDNNSHTVTTGTTNYGPIGIFDSGIISSGNSFTQFFGTAGKYHYYDKTDMWPSGLIVVTKSSTTHPELGWINGTLVLSKDPLSKNGIIISKEIENSGNEDANSIIFSLKIKNQTGFLFYNNMVKLNVPAKQSIPVQFAWNNPTNGNYQLMFEANAANTIGDMNANDDVSSDLISIPKETSSVSTTQTNPIIQQNFTLSNESVTVPEFGSVSYVILIISVMSFIVLSKYVKRIKLFS